ncbi:MAG: hypothetical protein ACRDCC_08230 [Culicoidibacterales bacterium]
MKKLIGICTALICLVVVLSAKTTINVSATEADKNTPYTTEEIQKIIESTKKLVENEPIKTISELRGESTPFSLQGEENSELMYPIGKVGEEILYSSQDLTEETLQPNEPELQNSELSRASVSMASGKVALTLGTITYSTPMYMLGADYVYCLQPYSANASGDYQQQATVKERKIAAVSSNGFPYNRTFNGTTYTNEQAYVRTWMALNYAYSGTFNKVTMQSDSGVAWLLAKMDALDVADYSQPTLDRTSATVGTDGQTGWFTVTNVPTGANIQVTAPSGMTAVVDGNKFYFKKGTASSGNQTGSVKFVNKSDAVMLTYGGSGTTQNLGKPQPFKDPSVARNFTITVPVSTAKITINHVNDLTNEVIHTESRDVTIGTVVTDKVKTEIVNPNESGTTFVPTNPNQTCNVTVNSNTTCTLNYRKKATININHIDIDTLVKLQNTITETKKEGDTFSYGLKAFANFRPQPTSQSYSGTIGVPTVQYASHPWGGPWQAFKEDSFSGTVGQSKAIEAIQVKMKNVPNVGIEVRAWGNVTNKWYDWSTSSSGAAGDKIGQIQMHLTGTDANKYDLYYRGHTSGTGWESWKKSGTKEAPVSMVASGKTIEAYQVKLVPKSGNKQVFNHDFTYKAQSTVTINHRDVVTGANLGTETIVVDRNSTATVTAKPNDHFKTTVEGATIPYKQEQNKPTSVTVTGNGNAQTVTFDYRKEFTHTITSVNGKNPSEVIAPKVTVKQLDQKNYVYTSANANKPTDKTWIESPKNQQYTGTANKNNEFIFYFKLPIADPTISVEIANPTNEVAFKGFVEWKLNKTSATAQSDIILEQSLEKTGNHYAIRNEFGTITDKTSNSVLATNQTVDGFKLKTDLLATNVKNKDVEYKAGYEFTNWYWRNYECVDKQDSYCFEWKEIAQTPDWSKVKKDELVATLKTEHQANETIDTETTADIELLIGQKQEVNGKTLSAIKDSHEYLALSTPTIALKTQTQIDMDSIQPTYRSDFNNPMYVTTGKTNVYVPDVMGELQDDYQNDSESDADLGAYVMPLEYSTTNGFQLGYHALAEVTTFQINEKQDIYAEYEANTGVAWEKSGDKLRDLERAYYIPIEAESVLKPKQTYAINYQLGSLGLSDITLEHQQNFSFESYMFGHISDDPYYLIQVDTPFAKDVTDYRYHYSMTPEQRQQIREIDDALSKGFVHTWARTNHGERSEALRTVLPDLPTHKN